jgi:hypothetical protein
MAISNSETVKRESVVHQMRCGCISELRYCYGVDANNFNLRFKIYYQIASITADVIRP